MDRRDELAFQSGLTDPLLFDTLPRLSLHLPHDSQLTSKSKGQVAAGAFDHPWSAPPYAYALLSADYNLQELRAAGAGDDFVPAPPPELSQSNFLSKARLCLVKLRRQVNEAVDRALTPVRFARALPPVR